MREMGFGDFLDMGFGDFLDGFENERDETESGFFRSRFRSG
jgi:hypothetical protein